jgi:phosphoribosyl 1,2-cyclic phosphate phosphodiesterase
VKLTFLGTGTSFGVPVVGCGCGVCRSPDERDRRTRHAALVQGGEQVLLVDTPPELRLQLIAAGVQRVDAVWYTHYHADHTHGVDDLRVFSVRRSQPLEVYGSEDCVRMLSRKFDYVFDPAIRPIAGTTKPEARMHVLEPYRERMVAGLPLLPLPVPHGHVDVYGFRIGELGYITDAKRLPEATLEALRGVRVLVLNALWFGDPHPTHFTVEEAVQVALDIGAETTYLTHLSHRVGHRELEDRLPLSVRPAHDGLVVEI